MSIGSFQEEATLACKRAERIYKYYKQVELLAEPEKSEGLAIIKKAYNSRADIYRRQKKHTAIGTEMHLKGVAEALLKSQKQVEEEIIIRAFRIYEALRDFDNFMEENSIPVKEFKNGKKDDFEGQTNFEYDQEKYL